MESSKGGFMSISTIIFVIGFVMCIGAILIYLKSEDTPFHKTLEKINTMQGDYNTFKKEINERFDKLEGKVTEAEVEMGKMMIVNGDTAKTCKEVSAECDQVQDYLRRLSKDHLQIRQAINMKSPEMKIDGPIVVEILTSKRRYSGKAQVKKATTRKTKKKVTRKVRPKSAKHKIMLEEEARRKKATKKKTKRKTKKKTKKKTTRKKTSKVAAKKTTKTAAVRPTIVDSPPPPPMHAKGLGRGMSALLS